MDLTDAAGRAWVSIATLMEETQIGSETTVRKALRRLAAEGWLRIEAMTWTRLRDEQRSAGRPEPWRSDDGQAPNLYTLLDGQGNPLGSARTAATSTGPGIARTAQHPEEQTPPQICRGGPPQIRGGEPPSNLPPDLDPSEQRTKTESEERGARSEHSHVAVVRQAESGTSEPKAWSVLVDAHYKQTINRFRIPPGNPDVRLEDRQTMADMLEGTATEAAAVIRARLGTAPEADELIRALADKAMEGYFGHKSPHNERTKWHLKSLPNEFHARLVDALDAVVRAYVRAHRDAQQRPEPRKVDVDQLDPEIRAELQKAEAIAQKCYGEQTPTSKLVEPQPPAPKQETKQQEACVAAPPDLRVWSPFRKPSAENLERLKRIEEELDEASRNKRAKPGQDTAKSTSEREGPPTTG